jgi:hypothetical protein
MKESGEMGKEMMTSAMKNVTGNSVQNEGEKEPGGNAKSFDYKSPSNAHR